MITKPQTANHYVQSPPSAGFLFWWPMISISVSGDFSRLAQRLREIGEKQAKYAAAVALTRTAQDAAKELNAELPRHLDNPTPFTRQAFTMRRATKSDLRAVVLAKPAQAKYLQYQVAGGSRAPNKKAQKLPSQIKLNAFGNIPRGEIVRLIALAKAGKRLTKAKGRKLGVSSKLNLFYGDPGNGRPPGIYKRVVNGEQQMLVPLIVFPQQQVQYRPRFPMRAIVERVVLAIEQMNQGNLGSDKLRLVLDRLAYLFPTTDATELRELVEATVARINLAKQGQGGAVGRGRSNYWTN